MNSANYSSPATKSAALSPDHLNRLLLVLAALIPALIAAAHFLLAPPVISHDTAIGFQVWRSMQDGAGWNQLLSPDPANIERSTGGYLAWWSPGQYLPAGLLMQLGLTMGTAVLLTGLIGAWSLAFGLCQLSRAMGSSPRAAAVAALSAAITWHTLYAFGFFIGGEVALLAVWPWLVLVAWRMQNRPWWQTILLPPLLVAGSYAKLSFGLYAGGLLVFLWLESARERHWQWQQMLASGARLAASAVIYLGAWHWLHSSRGTTPLAGGETVVSTATVIGFALNAPWFAATGFGSLAGRFFMLQGLSSDAGWARMHAALLIFGLAGAAGCCLLLRHRLRLMRLAGAISLVAALLLAILVMRGASISLEDRHLRPAGVLLLAACAHWATGPQAWPKTLAATALGLAMAFGLGATVQRISNLRQHAVRTRENISALDIDRASLRFLEQLDVPGRLIYLPDTKQSPLVCRARVLVRDAANQNVAWFAAHLLHGRVPTLVLALPGSFSTDGRARAVQASFKDYNESEWHRIHQGDWDFWQAGAAPAVASQ